MFNVRLESYGLVGLGVEKHAISNVHVQCFQWRYQPEVECIYTCVLLHVQLACLYMYVGWLSCLSRR
jgi:hypothetical protein